MKAKFDSINAITNHLDATQLECFQDGRCLYSLDITFDMIPDLPIRENIWTSIKSSQVASKIDVNLMAEASHFYNSWSHQTLKELLVTYNNSFINMGDIDAIPATELFFKLKTVHKVSLSKYEEVLPKFEALAGDMISKAKLHPSQNNSE